MRNMLLITATLFAALLSATAHAGFVPTDWKNSGDGLATLHEETGLEWLDLTQTEGWSVRDAVEAIDNGSLAGWRLPTNAEVEQLFTSWWSGHDVYNTSGNTVISSAGDFGRRNLDFNSMFGDGGRSANYTRGLYYDESDSIRGAGVYANANTYFYGLNFGNTHSVTSSGPTFGVYLVSDGGTTLSSINDPSLNANNPNAPVYADVPVPAGFGVIALAMLLGLRPLARRKRN